MSWQILDAQGKVQVNPAPTTGVWQPLINVKDYGAKGDGSTNDRASIQAAINAAQAAGVSGRGVAVWFPSGVYAIGSTLTVLQNNVSLIGEDFGSTVILPTFTTTDVIQFGDGGATQYGGNAFRNMQVFCGSARTTGASININKCQDIVVDNFSINNCFVGIHVQGATIKCDIGRGTINNISTTAGAAGIKVLNGAGGDTYLSSIVMSNPPASKGTVGIHITQAGHVSILKCNVTSCVKGLLVDPATSQDVSYLFIDHSLFDSCGSHGAHFTPSAAASARVRSVMCLNSWFSGTTAAGAGIEFTIASSAIVDGVSFIGCRVFNNYNHGVVINAGPTNISFTDCTIAGNGAQTVNTYDGISIAANVNGISVMNCKIGQSGTAGNQQRYAINVAAGTSANLNFAYNDCQPNGTLGNIGYINIGAITGGGNVFINNMPCVQRSLGSGRVTATSAFTTTETILTDTTAAFNRIMANAIRAGTTLRFRVWGSCTITTAAGTFQFRVRMGTNNTTSDGTIMDSTAVTTGAVGTATFELEVMVTCRTVGASATFTGSFKLINNSATVGMLPRSCGSLAGTASAGSTQNANYINLTGVGSANCSITIQGCTLEVVNS
jgi:hypothetical protein